MTAQEESDVTDVMENFRHTREICSYARDRSSRRFAVSVAHRLRTKTMLSGDRNEILRVRELVHEKGEVNVSKEENVLCCSLCSAHGVALNEAVRRLRFPLMGTISRIVKDMS